MEVEIKMQRFFLAVVFLTSAFGFYAESAKAENYWLVIGSYRQGPGRKPEVSGITSPSIYAIPMESLEQCKAAGEQISNEIYKPVWQFDNRWSCVPGR